MTLSSFSTMSSRMDQVVAVEIARAGAAEPVEQLLEAHHAAAARELGATLEHAAERALEAAIFEQLVGDLLHDVFWSEGVNLLGSVPAPIAIEAHTSPRACAGTHGLREP